MDRPAAVGEHIVGRRLQILAEKLKIPFMSEIVKDPEILGGLPVFRGTRVPVRNLFDYLTGGSTTKEFQEDFPTVTSEQIRSVLEAAELAVEEKAA